MSEPLELDDLDLRILRTLLTRADTSKSEIARRTGHAPSVISDRVRRLEDGGVLRGYEARLDTRALGHPLLAFAFITERKPTGGFDTGAALARVAGAEEVHKIAGEDCFLVKLRARDPEALAAVLDGEISKIRTVAATRTTIVLRTVTEGPPLSGTAEYGSRRGRAGGRRER